MLADISLYNLIANEYRNLMTVNTVDMMNTISRRIEEAVIDNALPIDFYAGFQRFSFFQLQQARYEKLATFVRRIYVLGVPDIPTPVIPGIEFIPLDEESNLALEWFLVINAPYFYTALLTREMAGEDKITGKRRFEGIWTHDEKIIEQCNLVLSQFLNRAYSPIHQRDYSRQNTYIVEIANKLVGQLEQTNLKRIQSQRLAEAIGQIAMAGVTIETQDKLLENITTSLRSSFKARTVTIWRPTEKNNEMELIAASGLPKNWRQAMYRFQPIDSSQLLSAQVFQNGTLAYIPDTQLSGEPDPFDPAVRSVIVMPLMAQGKLLGALQITDHRPQAYPKEWQASLQAVSAQIAFAMAGETSPASLTVEAFPSQSQDDLSWTVLNSTLDAIIILNPDKTIRFLNGAAYNLFQVTEAQVTGKQVDTLGRTELVEVVDNLQPELRMLYSELKLDKDNMYSVGASPMVDDQILSDQAEVVTGWVLVLRKQEDVFGKTHLDAVSTNTLAAQSKLADEISERMQKASNLIATLPKQTKLDATQVDILNQVKQLQHETREFTKMFSLLKPVDMAQDAPDKILQKLLFIDQSRSSEDEFSLIDVNSIVQNAIEARADLAATRNVSVVNKLSDKLPFIEANEGQIWRAAVEMLDNAVRYNPTGSTVSILVHHDVASLTLAMQDNGIGIWPKDIPFLFELFFRIRSPQTLKEPGKGVGLALVKAVATNHSGRAWAHSKIGKGSTFLMKIPIRREVRNLN